MDKPETLTEEELTCLLTSLRIERSYDKEFEERFLNDFHERVVQSSVCQPMPRSMFSGAREYLSTKAGRLMAYGAGSAVAAAFAGVMALNILVGPVSPDGQAIASLAAESPLSSIGSSLAALHRSDSIVHSADTCDLDINISVQKCDKPNYSGSKLVGESQTSFLPEEQPVLVSGMEATPTNVPSIGLPVKYTEVF